ncbi:MAG: ECF-type sigma factor [Phycisphaerae bacterium]|jgi:RNA polymerase sigma factor (TIGR02999 family)
MNSERHDDAEERRGTVTRLLKGGAGEEPRWAEQLLPLIYEELRALARARMAREGAGHTIQATALVHEAYLRLVGHDDPGWNGRRHFFGAAAQAMRRILVEQARRRGRIKHGGDRERVDLHSGFAALEEPDADVLGVDEVVRKLEARDPRKGQIVNLRYFAGFTAEETAEAIGLSLGAIEREWRFIKAWLREELEAQGNDPGEA